MSTSGPPWPQQALVHSKCPAFLSGRLCPHGRTEEHQWAPVLYFLLTDHLSSTIGSPSRKTKCPWLPPVLIWAHTVGVWATSLACIFDGRGLQFLLWRSSILQAGQWVHLPWVQPWETTLVTMANKPLHFLLPRVNGLYKHPLQNEWVV